MRKLSACCLLTLTTLIIGCGSQGSPPNAGTNSANGENVANGADAGSDASPDSDRGGAANGDDGADFGRTDASPDMGSADLGPIGGERPANVVVPSDWRSDGSYPVVVLLHGFTATSRVQNVYFRASTLVDELQFVLVLPEGRKNSAGQQFWAATDACCDFENQGDDDSAYLSQLGAEAVQRYAGDPSRLYFMGHSNGGYMSYRMACDHSDQIAAVASLAGATWQDPSRCGEPAPVGVLQIHGTVDPTVPYEGRPGIHPGAEETVERWGARNGCEGELTFVGESNYDSAVVGDETDKSTWSDCTSGVKTELWAMQGSGHVPAIDEQLTRDVLAFLFAHTR